MIVGLAVLVSTPLGILAGIYLTEYGDSSKTAEFTRFVTDIMLSAPSIVLGLFVYAVAVATVGNFSSYAGSLALSLIAIPVVMRTTENMLRLVPGSLREAAFALGAEAVQMGTRMVSAAESPVHQNWKDAIINAKETDTLFLNRHGPGPALRALRTERTTKLDMEPSDNIMGEMRGVLDLYFGGDMEAAIALSGQVAGRIDTVKPAKQIIDEVMDEFYAVMNDLRHGYL
jgi:hypothetical protein